MRILVVDDNVDTANSLARLLKLLGNDVEVAFHGKAAIEKARAFRPEFVLLDIGLPGMDGYQVASALRNDSAGERMVIVAISGYGQEDDRRRAREAGFDHHFVKPVDFSILTGYCSPSGRARIVFRRGMRAMDPTDDPPTT